MPILFFMLKFCLFCCISFIVNGTQVRQGKQDLPHKEYSAKHDTEPADHNPVFLEVYGDPSVHHRVRVKLTMPDHVRHIDLTKVETILHQDAKIVNFFLDSDGQPEFQVEEVEPDIKTLSEQFFHNPDLGTVVSLRKQSNGHYHMVGNGHYHMEGHLDRVNVIAPPSSGSRHPRALDAQGHTVYRSPDSYFLDSDQPDIWNLTEKVNRYKKLLSVFGDGATEFSKVPVHFGVPTANRTGQKLWEEIKRKVIRTNGGFGHDSDEDTSEDYLEVPMEFEDKKNWQVDNNGRVQRKADRKDDKNDDKKDDSRIDDFIRRGWRRKFRRHSFDRGDPDEPAEKYDFPGKTFAPDDDVTIDILGLNKPRRRQRRQSLADLTAFDLPSLFNWNTSSFYRPSQDYVVEVMVIVDARAYEEFQYDWSTLQVYLLHFWQSVNSRFREMVDPNVRLKVKSINKIIFSAYQPFIENNRIEAGSEKVDVNGVLMDFMKYIGQHYEANPSLPDHDVAILLTGEDLCRKKPDGTWSQKTKGIAFIRGGCISSRRFVNQSYDVGVAEVGRSFRGVLTAAHEVGHLLGAFHDGEKNASSCSATSGYIMSSIWNDPYIYNRYSNCSKQNIKHFLERTWYSECLLTSDSNYTTGYNSPSKLPGQVYTLVDQCQHYIEGIPCTTVTLESQCGQLCCEKWSQPFPSKEPAADGTVCGDRKMCYNGECLHQALIPYQ